MYSSTELCEHMQIQKARPIMLTVITVYPLNFAHVYYDQIQRKAQLRLITVLGDEIELVADYQRVKIEPKQPVGPCRRAFSIVSQVCFPREHVSPSVSIISHSLFSVCLPIGRPVGILAQ